MGKRGPKRKPAAVLKLHGTYRGDRHAGPDVPVDVPNCPTWLHREARAAWRRIVPQLVEHIGLARIDRELLAACLNEWARYYVACRKIDQEGAVIDGALGKRRNPWCVERDKALANFTRLAPHFGLSISSRTGLDVDIGRPASSAPNRSGLPGRKRGGTHAS